MRDTAEKICGHHMDMTNTTFILKFDLDRYKIYFVFTKICIIICRLLTNENTGI